MTGMHRRDAIKNARPAPAEELLEAVSDLLLMEWLRNAEDKVVDSPRGHCHRLAEQIMPWLAAHVATARAEALWEGAVLGRRATLDPGAFVKRGLDNDGNPYGEPLDRWQKRAADEAVARADREATS